MPSLKLHKFKTIVDFLWTAKEFVQSYKSNAVSLFPFVSFDPLHWQRGMNALGASVLFVKSVRLFYIDHGLFITASEVEGRPIDGMKTYTLLVVSSFFLG